MNLRLSLGICAASLMASPTAPPAWAHHGWGANSEDVGALNSLAALRERMMQDLSAREQSNVAVIGGISLVCRLTAIAADRMIAYW